MKMTFCVAFGLLALAAGFQPARAQEKEAPKDAPKEAAKRTLKAKVTYAGAGTVDDKHKILVFLFDSPDFAQGGVLPIGMQEAPSKETTVMFDGIDKSPVYVATVYDPAGAYDGQSPPPSGSSVGMYGKAPGQPGAIEIAEGKTAEIAFTFDDTIKIP